MSNAEWDNASTDKKLEMLRADIHKIFNVVNTLTTEIGAIHLTVRHNDITLKEVAKAVETIEDQLKTSVKGKKKR